jgi:hypothetical protein
MDFKSIIGHNTIFLTFMKGYSRIDNLILIILVYGKL